MLNFFFSWDAIPLETKTPMVERLELYPYSSFPLYWEDTLPAPAFLDRELLRGLLLPPPLEKNNTAYCMYCLTYAQNAEEYPHVEDMEPPVI